jgi:uncharacterized membrane protein SpoIIM required for sporulation
MEILNHQSLPFYLLVTFCILLGGCAISLAVNQPVNQTFNVTASPIYTMSTLEIFQTIFFKNLLATFLIMSISILGFRSIPTLFIGINGYMLGVTILSLNYNPSMIFAIIFPHGYFEFPLLLFSGSCAFIIIDEIKKTRLNAYTLLTKHGNPKIRYILKNYLFYPYLFIIIPGIFITAVLESTFSLWNFRILLGV